MGFGGFPSKDVSLPGRLGLPTDARVLSGWITLPQGMSFYIKWRDDQVSERMRPPARHRYLLRFV